MADQNFTLALPDMATFSDVDRYAKAMQRFNDIATNADVQTAVIQRRIIKLLKQHGLDGQAGGISGFFGGTTAKAAAREVAEPLRAFVAECENAAKAGHLFMRRFDNLVREPVLLAISQRKTGRDSDTLRVN